MKIRVPLIRGMIPPAEAGAAPAIDTGATETTGPRLIDGKLFVQFIAEVATNAWKAKSRLPLLKPDGESPDIRRLERNVDAILSSLADFGVTIKDHTHEAYDYGQALKVVAAEPREGIEREVVTETIRPSVSWDGNLVQRGEVVIATPKEEG